MKIDLRPFLSNIYAGISGVAISLSIIFHLLVVIFLVIGFSWKTKPDFRERVYTVEILPITNKTNIKNKTKEVEKKEVQKEEKEKPEVKKAPPKKEEKEKPEDIKNKEKEQPDKAEDKPKKKQEKDDDKKLSLKDKKEKDTKKEEKKKEKKKEKKTPVKNKNQDEDFDALLKNLEKSKPVSEDAEKDKVSARGPYDKSPQLSISIEDDIRRQLSECWTPPSGGMDAANMAVLLKIDLEKDGTVTNVEVVEKPNIGNERVARASIDAAIRAVKKCSPLQNLPIDSYETWRELEFNFDPRDLIY